MTMHLEGPWLSTTGKKKGKIKFKSSEQKREYERLTAEWRELLKRQGAELESKRQNRAMQAEPLTYNLGAPSGRFTSTHIPSRVTAGGSTAPVTKTYTGDQVLGVTIIHKSCLQPVFSQQEAIDAANMRR